MRRCSRCGTPACSLSRSGLAGWSCSARSLPRPFSTCSPRATSPDDRLLAGAIFGEILRRFHLLSYLCGTVLLGTLLIRGVLGPRPIWFAARVGTALLMLAATAYSGLVVSNQIARVQTAIGGGAVEPAADRFAPRRLRPAARDVHRPGDWFPCWVACFLLFRELKD